MSGEQDCPVFLKIKERYGFKNVLHTCLRRKNLEKSIIFYQDAFGFKELRRRDFPSCLHNFVYLGLEGEDYELELTYNYSRSVCGW